MNDLPIVDRRARKQERSVAVMRRQIMKQETNLFNKQNKSQMFSRNGKIIIKPLSHQECRKSHRHVNVSGLMPGQKIKAKPYGIGSHLRRELTGHKAQGLPESG